ncbi:MAG TPA: hypothetical protein VF209_04585 [Patescibacteria group bacterium]
MGPVNVTGTTCPDGHYANEDTCLANATGTGGDTAKQEGETCNATAECATGLACSAGVCKDISPNKPDGATCTSTSECQTGSACSAGICKDISPLKPEGDTCSSTAECRTGLACSAGTCKDIGQDKPIGALCVSNSQCQSGVCSEGKCQVSNNGTDDTGGDDNIPTNNLCLDGSGQTIIRSDVYTCPNGDTNGDGQCTSGDSGYTYATHPGVYTTEPTGVGDCWQIDYYSVDLATSQQRWGANPNDPAGYCGHAGHPELCQTTSTPPPGPIGPMCLNIKLNNVTTADAAPQLGDEITFTCGTVAGVTNYQFRVRTPAGQVQEVQASAAGSNTSQTVTIDTAGTYYAQCQVCNANGCSGWENLPSN